MNFFVCSDLHLDFHDKESKVFLHVLPKTDGIIIAGDLGVSHTLEENIDILCSLYKHVIFVAGNHDYYHDSIPNVNKLLGGIKHNNFYWLNNSDVVLNGVKFFGTTLWFQDINNVLYEEYMNDFDAIVDIRKHVYEENTKALRYLEHEDLTDAIVITHHLPTKRSVPPRFEYSKLNRFFVCDVPHLITRPKMWIHGHTHTFHDYMIEQTRILCNPAGYPFESSIRLNYNIILEI